MPDGATTRGSAPPSPRRLMRPPTLGPHFFVEPSAARDGEVTLDGHDAHHLARVLRARVGDPVSLADGVGTVWQAEVAGLDRQVRLALGDAWHVQPALPRLTVVQALPKGRKFDDVVQRLSEIGVDRLVPVTSRRTEQRLDGDRAARATRRWHATALAAAKQARRARPLDVGPIARWPGPLAPGSAGVVLWEQATVPLSEALPLDAWPDRQPVEEVVLAVGPEGGLEAAEVEACGLAAARLGPSILRTETAALVAASLVLARLGRLG